MNTPHDPTDDIIELTEIVEEGTPAGAGLDFAMDKAVDARSLDAELDDLLRDTGSALKRGPGEQPGMDFPSLSDGIPDMSPQSAPAAAGPQAGLTDLDDLFDSLQLDDTDEVQTSLDMLLDEKSQQRTAGTDIPPVDDSIDLDLDIPGMDDEDATPDLLELTDEILADIPETVLVPTGEAASPRSPEPLTLPSPEGLDLDLEAAPTPPEAPAASQPQRIPAEIPAAPEQMPTRPGDGVVSQAEFEILSARLDALEARPEPALDVRPEQVLAALPGSPEELPLTRNLRDGILHSVDDKLAATAKAEELASLRLLAEDTAARIAALEARPEPTPGISPELVLAAMPDSPEELPLTRNLRDVILQSMDAKFASAAAEVSGLRQMTEDLVGRISAAEAKPEPSLEIRPEQVLAALPDSADGLPLTRSLREEILQHVETKASTEALGRMQRAMEALQNQVDAMPEMLAKLASTSAPALQELESGLGALQTLVKGLEQGIDGIRAAMAGKDAAMAELRAGEERLREEVEALAARMESQPDARALRSELEAHIRQQVPAAVARVIREEIQALLKEMGS